MNTKKIIQAMKDKNMTIHKLAQKSNVAYATVYSIVHEENVNPKIETLQKIAEALEVNIHSLLKGGDDVEKSHIED